MRLHDVDGTLQPPPPPMDMQSSPVVAPSPPKSPPMRVGPPEHSPLDDASALLLDEPGHEEEQEEEQEHDVLEEEQAPQPAPMMFFNPSAGSGAGTAGSPASKTSKGKGKGKGLSYGAFGASQHLTYGVGAATLPRRLSGTSTGSAGAPPAAPPANSAPPMSLPQVSSDVRDLSVGSAHSHESHSEALVPPTGGAGGMLGYFTGTAADGAGSPGSARGSFTGSAGAAGVSRLDDETASQEAAMEGGSTAGPPRVAFFNPAAQPARARSGTAESERL